MKAFRMLAVAAVVGAIAVPAQAAGGAEVGKVAPDFTARTSTGEEIRLSDYRGRIVVLEWTNHQCPYVRKHYQGGNMQDLQAFAKENDIVWLTIVSSAPDAQGYVTANKANALTRDREALPSHVLLDSEGAIGRSYGARVTPEMFVIRADGTVAYMGAIDDRPTWRPASLEGATNHVLPAMKAVLAGDPVETPVTRAYGCTIKYKEGS